MAALLSRKRKGLVSVSSFFAPKIKKTKSPLRAASSEAVHSKFRVDKDGWSWHNTLLFWETEEKPKPSAKIAAFDFDGCVAKTSLFKKGPDAWKFLVPEVPARLRSLQKEGYKVVVFTNQSDIGRMKKPETRARAEAEKKGRLGGMAKAVGIPMQVFVATAAAAPKKERSKPGFDPAKHDMFRKPSTGMWEFLVEHANGGVPVDLESSFFVGDAAGRVGDHGASDKQFAEKIGLTFHTEEFFSTPPPPEVEEGNPVSG